MTDTLARIARRDGMEAAARAYDAGQQTPALKLPVSKPTRE